MTTAPYLILAASCGGLTYWVELLMIRKGPLCPKALGPFLLGLLLYTSVGAVLAFLVFEAPIHGVIAGVAIAVFCGTVISYGVEYFVSLILKKFLFADLTIDSNRVLVVKIANWTEASCGAHRVTLARGKYTRRLAETHTVEEVVLAMREEIERLHGRKAITKDEAKSKHSRVTNALKTARAYQETDNQIKALETVVVCAYGTLELDHCMNELLAQRRGLKRDHLRAKLRRTI